MFASKEQLLLYLDLLIQRGEILQIFKFVNIYPNIINSPDKLKIITSNLGIKYNDNYRLKDIILHLSIKKIFDICFYLNNGNLINTINIKLWSNNINRSSFINYI